MSLALHTACAVGYLQKKDVYKTVNTPTFLPAIPAGYAGNEADEKRLIDGSDGYDGLAFAGLNAGGNGG